MPHSVSNMQCVTYDIERVGFAEFSATALHPIYFDAVSTEGATFSARATEAARMTAVLAESVMFSAQRVCSFFPGAALGVTPEVVWLNEGNDYTATFEVSSNVEWKIE